MTGLYFYKLVSPYEDDVTKDCKLTVNEIDHNFVTLKDADINDAVYDDLSNKITLTRNNGDTMEVDLSSIVDDMTTNLEVDYDSVEGKITITYNDKKAVIDGIITKDNLCDEILTEVIGDGTVKGDGTYGNPLGLSLVEKTGQYKPAKRFINLANGEFLPNPKHLAVGDRFVTYEFTNDYGFLYNYDAVKKLESDLKHGWRVPSKSDWDNMLNAIEPCDDFKTHSSQMANTVLGKLAGKFLKDKLRWSNYKDGEDPCKCGCDCDCHDDEVHPHDKHPFDPHHPHYHDVCNDFVDDDEPFDIEEDIRTQLKKKKIHPHGIDKFGMGLLPAGYGDGCRMMAYFNKRGEYWTSTLTDSLDIYSKRFDYDKAGVVQNLQSPASLFSIRLVKDYDGKNFHEVENIMGVDYPCVLMPSENSEHGFAIWTAVNLAIASKRYNPVLPNHGEGLGRGARPSFNIYAWDGHDFVKKTMQEGESIVLERGLRDEYNGEYRLTHGKLVNVTDIVYHEIMKVIEPRLDKIEDRLDDIDDEIEVINKEISGLQESQTELEEKLNHEILDRQQVDKEQWDAINGEIESRLQVDAQMWEAINNEASARTEVEAQLWEAINNEASARTEVDTQMWEAINTEVSARTEVDTQMWEAINTEVSARTEVDTQMWEAINNEASARTEVEAQLWEAINTEVSARTEVDAQMWEAINTEVSARTEVDAQMWEAINNEVSARTEVEAQLWEAINNESAIREEIDNQIWDKLNAEIERSIKEDEYIEGRLISKEGSTFDCSDKGVLTLVTDNPENTITIALSGNYGTF